MVIKLLDLVLKMAIKQGGVIQAYSNHRASRYALELSFAIHASHTLCCSTKEVCSLLTSQRGRQMHTVL
jgi:hypothetical protein